SSRKFDGKVDEGFLVGYSNNDGDAAFDGKEPDFDAKKPESEVNVTSSSSARSRKQDDKTKKEAKGNSPVESFTGYRDLSAEFEDCSNNSINEVNAVGTIVPTVGQNSFNNTNTFSAAGLSNANASPTYRKYSLIDASQLPNDLDMLELEDITYSDDEDDDSPFDLVAYSDSDYAGASLDRKSTTGGCQFLGCSDSPLLGVNTPRSDEDMLELIELMVFLLPKFEKVRIRVNAVDLQISAVRHMLLLFVHKLLLFSLTNWRCSLSAVRSIKYALTVNPNIYVSCIKQCWTTVAVKQVNDVIRLQALVDRKKVVITEAIIREALHLDDAEGMDCLPNEEIFTELARMGYEKPSTKLTFYKAFFSSQWKFLIHTILQCMSAKRTSWNEFSSSMESAVICLSSGRKFNFSKYIFDSLKVFANMRRVGKGFSGVETPLFEGDDSAAHGDVSAAHGEVPTVVEEQSIPSPIPPTQPPQPPQDIPSTSQVQQTPPQSPQEQPPSPQPQPLPQPQQAAEFLMIENEGEETGEEEQGESVKAQKVTEEAKADESAQDQGRQAESQAEIYKIDMDHANKVLSIQGDETEPVEVQEVVDVVTTAKLITGLVTAASETVTTASAIITTAEAQVPAATLTAAPARVAAAPSRRRKGVVIRDPEEESTISTIILAETKFKDKAIDHVKRKAKEDPAVKKYQAMKRKPQTEAQTRKNMMMYLKNVAGFKMGYFKGMSYDDIQTRYTCSDLEESKNCTWSSKGQRMEATGIMWCADHNGYIYSADFVSREEDKFNSNVAFLLKTKEQIEEDENRALQKINETPTKRAAKRRKLDEKKNQRTVHGPAKVKGWKLLESCGVQIITVTSTQLILLVERKYPLTRFTLDQMLNAVRLEVEEESEVSLELLRFTRQQHQEGQLE
nr:hypothetical protein [Tanacetum cinerariifolium]